MLIFAGIHAFYPSLPFFLPIGERDRNEGFWEKLAIFDFLNKLAKKSKKIKELYA